MKVDTKNISKIDALIPEAERYADIELNLFSTRSAAGRLTREWSRIFLDRMNELTIAAGLRVSFDDY